MNEIDAFGPLSGFDPAAEVARITQFIQDIVPRRQHRRGVVLGVSGGVDSALCLQLACRALGPDHVLALLLPEKESPSLGTDQARRLCASLHVPHCLEDITPMLEASGAYAMRDAAISRLIPAYGSGWRQKIVLANDPSGVEVSRFDLVVEDEQGRQRRVRMTAEAYRQIVASTNMKQRIRKMREYFHAEAANFAVLGTPNRLEYSLGFFVRGGDGLADLKPIAHLYKLQVYALARHLGLPDEIIRQAPSTGTFSLEQTQDEFYFGLAWAATDRLLWAQDQDADPATAGRWLGMTAEQVANVWRSFGGKQRSAARSLGEAALLDEMGNMFDRDVHRGQAELIH